MVYFPPQRWSVHMSVFPLSSWMLTHLITLSTLNPLYLGHTVCRNGLIPSLARISLTMRSYMACIGPWYKGPSYPYTSDRRKGDSPQPFRGIQWASPLSLHTTVRFEVWRVPYPSHLQYHRSIRGKQITMICNPLYLISIRGMYTSIPYYVRLWHCAIANPTYRGLICVLMLGNKHLTNLCNMWRPHE